MASRPASLDKAVSSMSNTIPQLSEDDVGHWPPASEHIFTHLYTHMNMYTHKNRYSQPYAHSPIHTHEHAHTHTRMFSLSLSSFIMVPFTFLIGLPKAAWAPGPYQPERFFPFPLTPEWNGCLLSAALPLRPSSCSCACVPTGQGGQWMGLGTCLPLRHLEPLALCEALLNTLMVSEKIGHTSWESRMKMTWNELTNANFRKKPTRTNASLNKQEALWAWKISPNFLPAEGLFIEANQQCLPGFP